MSIILRKSDIMKNKIDLRVLKTEESIKSTFKTMLLEMPYEKITIKELCERAVINRKTFYLHYNSIDDVLEEFQEELASEYFDRIKDFDHIANVEKMIEAFFLFSEEKGEFYEKIHCNYNYDYIHQQTTNKLSLKVQDNLKSIRKFTPEKQDIILAFVNSATLGIYRQWIKDGKKIPVGEVIDIASTFVKTGLAKYMK